MVLRSGFYHSSTTNILMVVNILLLRVKQNVLYEDCYHSFLLNELKYVQVTSHK